MPSAEASTALRWHVLHVKPGRDDFVGRQIAAGRTASGRTLPGGYRVWIGRRTVRNTRHEIVRELLFPGYVLVQFNAVPDQWAPLYFVDAVVRLISTPAYRPIPLATDIVEAFIRLCEIKPANAPGGTLRPGERVVITSGPLMSFAGEVMALPAPGRVEVLLGLFGRPTRVTLSSDDVRTA